MSVLLAIDTAAPRLQLAVLLANGRIVSLVEEMATGQAERLFPALAELLARAGASYADLDRVAVTTGPGSFTGLRIGLSAARGLALALGIPALGIPSLLALSLGEPGASTVLLDARRGEAYHQLFILPGEPVSVPMLLPVAEAESRVLRGVALITSPFVDISALADFARAAEPDDWPPEATYIRGADAKPQTKFRIPRIPS